MKSRKKILSTLMGVALTSQMLPSTYTIVANAQTPSVTTVIERQGQNSENEEAQGQAKNGLDNMIIALLGVGCDEGTHKFEIRFNTKTMKLEPKIACGRGFGYGGVHPFHPYFGDNPYVTITLLDQYGNIKNKFSLRGNASVEEVEVLNNWSFEYGDRLKISHREADWRVKFYGNVTNPQGERVTGLDERTSQDVLNTYDFKITKSGLQEVPAFTNEIANNKITFSGVGCQEGTHKFDLSFNTQTNKLNVDGLVGVGYTGKHPFHPSFEGEYIRISLLDENENVKNEFTMTGPENVKKALELNNWSFKYGDRLRIYHAQVAQTGWRVKIAGRVYKDSGEIVHLDQCTSKAEFDRYDFQITKSGLKEVEKNVAEVSNSNDLIDALKDKKPKIIKLTHDITFNEADISKLESGFNNSKELIVAAGVSIEGNNHIIDFNRVASLTLKGNNIKLSNVKIKNCANVGMQIYNSRDVYLKNVTLEDAQRYGLFVNASTVKLDNCTTRNNHEGGIFISRSITLQDDNKYTDSEVKVIARLTQEETTVPKVLIKNLQMINGQTTDGRMQNNTFIPVASQHYDESVSNESITLNKVYCDILKLPYGTKVNQVTHKYN